MSDFDKKLDRIAAAMEQQSKVITKLIKGTPTGGADAGLKEAKEKVSLRDQETVYLEKQLKLLKTQQETTKNIVEKKSVELELANRALELQNEHLKKEKKKLEEATKQTKLALEKEDLDEKAREAHEESLKLLKEQREELDKKLVANTKDLEASDKLVASAEQLLTEMKAAGELAGQFAQKFRTPDQRVTKFRGQVTELGGQLKTAFDGGIYSAMNFADVVGGQLWDVMIDNMASLVLEVYDAENAFRKATGANQEFARGMTETYKATRELGVSMKDAAAAHEALFKVTTDFTMMSKAERAELGQNAAMLQKYGISHQDFAASAQVSIKALGQTAAEAGDTARELNAFAQDIGVPPAQIAADYAQAGSVLGKFGDDGVQAFKDLSAVSKITGMDLNKLFDLTAKFDTFEGAADQAGKLNAALGGNFVNAMDLMMETDPAERFKQIRGAITDAGLSFDDMSYYQKNFYKDALGLQDVGELANMLSGDMSALENQVGKTSAEYAEQAKQAKSLASLQEQWNMLVQEMVPILTPVIDLLRSVMHWFGENTWALKGLVGAFMLYKAAQVASWVLSKFSNKTKEDEVQKTQDLAEATSELAKAQFRQAIAQQLANGKMGAAVAAASALAYIFFEKSYASNFIEGVIKFGQAFDAMGDSLETILEAFSKNAKGALAFGAAMLQMGAGVAIAALGLAELARAFGEAGDNAGSAVAAVAILGVTMIGLAAAITAFVVYTGGTGALAVLAFGAAFLMLGAGVALAAFGFKAFIEVAQELTLETIMNLSVGIVALGMALQMFASPLLTLAAWNLVALAGGLTLLGASFMVLEESQLGLILMVGAFGLLQKMVEAIIAPFEILASLFTVLGDPVKLMAIGEGFGEIAQEIANLPVAKTIMLTSTLGKASAAAHAINTVGGGEAYAQKVVEALGATGAPGAAGTPGAAGAPGAAATTAPRKQELTVNLNLAGKTIDTKVIEIINDKIIRPGWAGGVG